MSSQNGRTGRTALEPGSPVSRNALALRRFADSAGIAWRRWAPCPKGRSGGMPKSQVIGLVVCDYSPVGRGPLRWGARIVAGAAAAPTSCALRMLSQSRKLFGAKLLPIPRNRAQTSLLGA